MELILDYSKWRCGRESKNGLGLGATSLLNSQGFMCCLGQFALQLNPNLRPDQIIYKGMSSQVDTEITGLNYFNNDNGWRDSNLSRVAVVINDSPNTTPDKKIKLLTHLFEKHGHTIKVVNHP